MARVLLPQVPGSSSSSRSRSRSRSRSSSSTTTRQVTLRLRVTAVRQRKRTFKHVVGVCPMADTSGVRWRMQHRACQGACAQRRTAGWPWTRRRASRRARASAGPPAPWPPAGTGIGAARVGDRGSSQSVCRGRGRESVPRARVRACVRWARDRRGAVSWSTRACVCVCVCVRACVAGVAATYRLEAVAPLLPRQPLVGVELPEPERRRRRSGSVGGVQSRAAAAFIYKKRGARGCKKKGAREFVAQGRKL